MQNLHWFYIDFCPFCTGFQSGFQSGRVQSKWLELFCPKTPFCLVVFNMPNPNRYDILSISIFSKILLSISFKNVLIEISIFRNGHFDIDIFKIHISIFLSISIFSKISCQHFVDINILKRSADMLSIFQKSRYIDIQYRYFIIKAWTLNNSKICF